MVGLLTAEPTPKKPKKQSTNKPGRRSKEPVKKLFKSGKKGTVLILKEDDR